MQTRSVLCVIFILYLSHSNCEIDNDNMAEKWTLYKQEHGKDYSAEEDGRRFTVFQENLKMIEEHNEKHKRGEVTFTMGMNQFTDWFPEERAKMQGGLLKRDDKTEK